MKRRIFCSLAYSIFFFVITTIILKIGCSIPYDIFASVTSTIGVFVGTFVGYGFGKYDKDRDNEH